MEESFSFDGPNAFKDNFGNIISPIELVFPIVRINSEQNFEAVGTGFFIHPAGGFVTAKHCLFGPQGYDDSCYAIHSIGTEHLVRKIQYFEPHPEGDIGIGMLRGQMKDNYGNTFLRPSFPISLTRPIIGEEIMTFAYPHMQIAEDNLGSFPGHWYKGDILEFLPYGTGLLKTEAFLTSMLIRQGASGGPVLRGNSLIGVNSSGFDILENDDPISFITPISQVFDLVLIDSDGQKTTVKQLMNEGFMAFVE
jgi:hypothetical protein